MNIAVPQIQSVGAPPELHADRVAGEMVRWLIAERELRWRHWWAEWERGSIGNPKGQQRMWARMVEAAGPFLLYHRLTPGKRARFELEVVTRQGRYPAPTSVPISDMASSSSPRIMRCRGSVSVPARARRPIFLKQCRRCSMRLPK